MTEHTPFAGGAPHRAGGNHPLMSLIILLSMVFAGAVVFGVLSVMVALIATGGMRDLANLEGLLSGGTSNAAFLKIVQAGSSIGMFIVPALLMGVIERPRNRYLDFKTPVKPILWLLVIAIMFFAAPVFEQAIKLNERMQLPEAFSGIENWMKAKEAEAKQLTHLLLSDTTYWGLFINLVVVAVIPAIGEEFIFRGCVQRLLVRWLKNPHIAIWLAAIIFSAIHLQFYGFLPRLLLGALFGYLLYWGKNIWLPVLAHFLNNAAATISAFYLQRQGKSLDELDFGDKIPLYIYFVSFVLTAVLVYQFYKTATAQNTRHHGERLD